MSAEPHKPDANWLRQDVLRAFILSGESIERLAAECGVTRVTLSRYLNGKSHMRSDRVAKLIELLGKREAVSAALRAEPQ